MRPLKFYVIVLLPLAAGILTVTAPCHGEGFYKQPNDTATEIAQLPRFCYAQYVNNALKESPEYSIVKACGVWMNHFCPGLLNIMRAEAATYNPKKFNRREELRAARDNMQYTLAHIPADCIYRRDVDAAVKHLELLEKRPR